MSKLYTSLANVYHEIYQTLFDYDEEFSFYDHHLKTNGVKSVLEIGCGTGNLSKRLINSKYDYLGIDLYQEMLEIAKITAPNAKFMQADVRDFSLQSPVDCTIITGRSISYLIDNQGVIDAFTCIGRSLVPNGLLMFDAIDAQKFFVGFEENRHDELMASYEKNHYRRVSKSNRNMLTGWTWDWTSSYYQKNDAQNFELIGNDTVTLRAFLQEELGLFLKLAGFELLEILPKKSYAWDDNFYIAKKK